MSEKQTINDLLMEVAKLRKDNDYLKGELGYWKQQAQSVTDGCEKRTCRNLAEAPDFECSECGGLYFDIYHLDFCPKCGARRVVDGGEADSREKLEEDCEKLIENIQRRIFSGRDAGALRCQLKELLDRQAAITRAECQKDSENVADWEDSCDTREILEHDCKWMAYAWAPAEYPDDKLEKKLYREIIEKLDRQAAITRAEWCNEKGWWDSARACNDVTAVCYEKDERIAELEAALDAKHGALDIAVKNESNLEQRIIELEKDNDKLMQKVADAKVGVIGCPAYNPETHYCKWHDADFELNESTLLKLRQDNYALRNERDELRNENAKLKAKNAEIREKFWGGDA